MQWKFLAASLALISAFIAPVPAASLDRAAGKSGNAVSKDDVRKAIAIFRRNPVSVQGEMTVPLIMQFAKDSPDVEVAISEKRMPWIANKSLSVDLSRALVVAYMAGDIEVQLDQGKAKDDPIAAEEQVITTYRQMQKVDSRLKIPEVENLIDLQKHGKLAEHFKGE